MVSHGSWLTTVHHPLFTLTLFYFDPPYTLHSSTLLFILGQPHEDSVATSRAMMRAAKQAGIRINLLYTIYNRGGFEDEPLSERQARFRAPDFESVERVVDTLSQEPMVDGKSVAFGLAIHSVRAVPPAWLGPIGELTRSHGIMLHAHASEQKIEVDECWEKLGVSPIGLLEREGALSDNTTIVHGTWLDDADISMLSRTSAGVCLCPTTEGDLGDGVPRTSDLNDAGVRLSIGSDSHAVIDPFMELKMAEYQARAATQQRCVLIDQAGCVAPKLLDEIGHTNGYIALGLPGDGDLVLLDADARAMTNLNGTEGATVADMAMTAGHPGLVSGVRVGGVDVVVDGVHLER
mmetsp:Transcript_110024/g.320264  ORF Transcript_110024/g.320264 Transcript_110024/m.320264 type:complete len:349 (-) Transcript_110024:142-1188(-)